MNGLSYRIEAIAVIMKCNALQCLNSCDVDCCLCSATKNSYICNSLSLAFVCHSRIDITTSHPHNFRNFHQKSAFENKLP